MGMAKPTFSEPWWTIAIAITWLLTRDPASVDEGGGIGWQLRHLQPWLRQRERPAGIDCPPDEGAAWLKVREAVGAGKIKAAGIASIRMEKREGPLVPSSWSYRPAEQFAKLASLISATKFGSAQLRNTTGDDYLATDAGHAHPPPGMVLIEGYEDPRVLRDDLVRLFPGRDGDLQTVLTWDLPRNQQRRIECASRFIEEQRRKRDWINFGEIAEWCSELGGSVMPDEDARNAAYEKLQEDLLAGFFDDGGRTRVLFLRPDGIVAKMTRRRLRWAMELYDPELVRSVHLAHCWIPGRMFARWRAVHNLPMSAPRFQVVSGTVNSPAPIATGAKERGVIEAIAAIWPGGVPAGLAGKERDNAIVDWLQANGHSVPTDVSRAVQRALRKIRAGKSDPG
jgi:hypothetical protein